MASASIEDEAVSTQASSLVSATPRLAISAAKTARGDSSALTGVPCPNPNAVSALPAAPPSLSPLLPARRCLDTAAAEADAEVVGRVVAMADERRVAGRLG